MKVLPMKKIMFKDKYGLTRAVLEGRKTQTRRIVPVDIINAVDTLCLISFSKEKLTEKEKDYNCYETCDGDFIDVRDVAKYKRGEEVAVAQCYGNCGTWFFPVAEYGHMAGYTNKMFVCADLMPYRIRITNIRVERLQDIEDCDCFAEGVCEAVKYMKNLAPTDLVRDIFAALIDKTCGKGTWDSNPWVFVYDFELIK